jgi:hypothetical protein
LVATFLFAVVAAFFVNLGLVSITPLANGLTGAHFENSEFAKNLMIIVLVGMSAVAGAWRYLTERLNVEAEAHEYRDAGMRFSHAKDRLAKCFAHGIPANQGPARAIVEDLGRLALAENEAWLKSRRERPLTPVVG